MRGYITRLNQTRGFGFLVPEGEIGEVFFHAAGVIEDFRGLREGDFVGFELSSNPRGPRARRVERLADQGDPWPGRRAASEDSDAT